MGPGDADRAGDDAGALLASLPCGVLSFTDEGRVLVVNAGLRELLGYDAGELEGRHVESLLTLAGRIFYQTHLFPLLRLEGRAREIFLLLRRKDGGEVGAIANAVRRERGGAAVNDCVLLEVRERRKYEDELLRARRAAESANVRLREQTVELERQRELLEDQAVELEAQRDELGAANAALLARSAELELARAVADAANRAKSDFLTTMSHELRTPLNAIAGYAQLIDLGVHGPVTPEQRHALGRIDRSQRHLLRLVNEVLNLARIESGLADYVLADVPLAAVIASVAPMLEPQLAEARLAFTASAPDDVVARADGDKVQQVILNLVTNAVKFTPAGGHVAIEARRDDAARRVLVRVTDTGIGIRPEKLDVIFEPFVQVDAGLTRTRDGTGLGLAISRNLARGMGGDLTVESRVGAGSTFVLTLPRA